MLLGGAALTRSYVERDLREVYEGRLFYGRDAFEGLHTMDKLMDLKRSGDDDPDFGMVPSGRILPGSSQPSARDEAVDAAAPVARRRHRQRRVPAAVPRQPRREGHRARRHRRVHQRDGAVPQPVAVPAGGGRDRRRVQGPHPARCCASSWPTAKASGVLVPQVVYGYFPVNADGDELVVWTDEDAHGRAGPVPLPAPEGRAVPVHRRLLPAGRVGRARLRRLPHRHHGRGRLGGHGEAVRREPLPGVPAAARHRRGDGRGAGRAVAPAHPRGVGLRRRGRPDAGRACSASSTAAAATRGATPRAPTSRTTPPWPACSGPSGSASR